MGISIYRNDHWALYSMRTKAPIEHLSVQGWLSDNRMYKRRRLYYIRFRVMNII